MFIGLLYQMRYSHPGAVQCIVNTTSHICYYSVVSTISLTSTAIVSTALTGHDGLSMIKYACPITWVTKSPSQACHTLQIVGNIIRLCLRRTVMIRYRWQIGGMACSQTIGSGEVWQSSFVMKKILTKHETWFWAWREISSMLKTEIMMAIKNEN